MVQERKVLGGLTPKPVSAERLSWVSSSSSLEAVGSEGVLHGGVGQHQIPVQHVQSQRVHPERVVQREGVHLEARDVRQSAGDLFREARGGVSCRRREGGKH